MTATSYLKGHIIYVDSKILRGISASGTMMNSPQHGAHAVGVIMNENKIINFKCPKCSQGYGWAESFLARESVLLACEVCGTTLIPADKAKKPAQGFMETISETLKEILDCLKRIEEKINE